LKTENYVFNHKDHTGS